MRGFAPIIMSQHLSGIFFGLAAFVSWGLLPVYWKQLQPVAPFEILCHRIIWSCVFLCLIIAYQQRWSDVADIIRNRAQVKKLCASG
jgi:chloramphenicol-sensitive protein RarD